MSRLAKIRRAAWRAFRTFGQSFFGTVAGLQVLLQASFATEVATAAIVAGISAGGAFFMNLDEEVA